MENRFDPTDSPERVLQRQKYYAMRDAQNQGADPRVTSMLGKDFRQSYPMVSDPQTEGTTPDDNINLASYGSDRMKEFGKATLNGLRPAFDATSPGGDPPSVSGMPMWKRIFGGW